MTVKRMISSLVLAMALSVSVVAGAGITEIKTDAAGVTEVAEYSGNASVQINGGTPQFSKKDMSTKSFESYSALDSLGRCGTATACIGKDLMPTEERGGIGMIKPSGWNQNKYPGIVNSNPPYLYNRCHLIGYQLTGENANERNLITGTRYMNVEGMLPFENKVAGYVESTGNHVLYRVTPDFDKDNLLCSGVQIEAYSVEDLGTGISFNVYCYNVQPGVDIDYSDGSNKLSDGYRVKDNAAAVSTKKIAEAESTPRTQPASSYIANKNTKKFHYPSCSSVDDMKEKNKLYFNGSRDELIGQGYIPCKRCNP